MKVIGNIITACLIVASIFYSSTLSAQPHYHPVSKDRYTYKNSLTINGGIGAFCMEIGAGAFAEYQRYIDKGGKWSLDLKAAVFTSGTIGVADEGQTRIKISGNYIAPGLRYHIGGNTHIADFSIGLSVPFGGLTLKENHIPGGSSSPPKQDIERDGSLYGALGQMVLDIRPRGEFTLGAFMQFGVLFTSVRTGANGEVNPGCVNFGLRFGGFW
jgi:hypothetical protein